MTTTVASDTLCEAGTDHEQPRNPAMQPMVTKTLAEIAEHCGAALEGDGSRRVTGPADLAGADVDQVSFLANPRYASLLSETRAAGVLVTREVECSRPELVLLRVEDPSRAFTEVVRLFAGAEEPVSPGVHPGAVVDPTAKIGPEVSIGAFCVVGAGAQLGSGVVLHPRVTVGAGCLVGERTVLHPGVVLYPRMQLGKDCIVHAGAVIGSDGFGYEPTPEGWSKIPQCGIVVIEDNVEIGAGCTIDRARFGATTIGRGVKLDNLVHVAHNVQVGAASLLVAQVGISGSTRVGKRVILAGQVGVGGHLEIGDGAKVGGQGGVTRSVPPGVEYTGTPARPVRQVMRELVNAKRVPQLQERIEELEQRLRRLEEEGR